jgi:Metal binding domain of Ada
MWQHQGLSDFKALVHSGKIKLAGNRPLKIYGLLSCRSGKRMNISTRVFFESEQEAIAHGFRPCGHCLKAAYKDWLQFNNSGGQSASWFEG